MLTKSIITNPIASLFSLIIPQNHDSQSVTQKIEDQELLNTIDQQTKVNNLTYQWYYNHSGKIEGKWVAKN